MFKIYNQIYQVNPLKIHIKANKQIAVHLETGFVKFNPQMVAHTVFSIFRTEFKYFFFL